MLTLECPIIIHNNDTLRPNCIFISWMTTVLVFLNMFIINVLPLIWWIKELTSITTQHEPFNISEHDKLFRAEPEFEDNGGVTAGHNEKRK